MYDEQKLRLRLLSFDCACAPASISRFEPVAVATTSAVYKLLTDAIVEVPTGHIRFAAPGYYGQITNYALLLAFLLCIEVVPVP
ncbi:hypothetical protein DPMN_194008 [Dreissena polymorpha]|uniref:Uncharacterized protein n=1 Tax=Dreissena polymorpha TaxID=45954 RepID=A0A9D3Y400_DREPO|nr:hypothetical protein DPMN_194008 [Dreissena polymorpha]